VGRAPVESVFSAPCRIGLVSDTHGDIVHWGEIQTRLDPLLEGVDVILHCGDVGSYEVLDALSERAPVLAIRSDGDPGEREPDLISGQRVLQCGDIRIGAVFSLDAVDISEEGDLCFPSFSPGQVGPSMFGGPVDVVVFGGTHQDVIAHTGGILFVNPGSPSLAARTTAGVLSIRGGVATARILPVS
jgi:uncharacterized protein